MKIKKLLNKEFRRHHAFILIIFAIGLFFAGNVLAYSALENSVNEEAVLASNGTSVILNRVDEPEAEADPEKPVGNSLKNSQSILDEFVHNSPVTAGVFLQDLETGDYIGANESVTFEAASLYKLFVAYEAYKRIDLGIHDASQVLDTESGPKSIDYCLEVSISVSDNPCGRALRELVEANIEPLPSLADAGFVGTTLFNSYPTTSAKDVGLLFEKLHLGQDLSEESNEKFTEHLKAQTFTNRIPSGLPDNVITANKTGDLEGYSHDGALIYSPRGDFVLVVLSGPWENGYNDAPPVISEFVSKLYNSLN